MTSAWSQLEQLLTCAICLDRYRSPRLLPCQHSFCEFCMDGLIDYARRQIKCPECRAEHRIPYNGVQSLPTNVTLMRFLELHRSITGEEPDPLPSQLERCSVCTEKTLCTRCAHCEKRTCDDCKEAHLEILRREIQRLVLQIRRGAGRINEVLDATDKNSDKLILSKSSIKEEISENFRRFLKDLKEKEDRMQAQVDDVLEGEAKTLVRLKADLQTELDHLTSNCDLADKYISVEGCYEWTDEELVSYKDVFIRSLDFLRNFDYDSPDNIRKLKLLYNTDIDLLRKTFKDFIELKVVDPPNMSSNSSGSGGGHGGSDSKSNQSQNTPLQNSLMRSQSDHRLVAQFHQKRSGESGGSSRYGGLGSDSERDRSPPGVAHRSGSIRDSRLGRSSAAAGDYDDGSSKSRYLRASDALRDWPRPSDDDYSSSGGSKFRSRFLRDRQAEEEAQAEDDALGSLRSVRFEENAVPVPVRPKVFDSESSSRAPLSGVIKLVDSPAFAERLHQSEVRQKQKRELTTTNGETNSSTVPMLTAGDKMAEVKSTGLSRTSTTTATQRQVSEDEIDKQKKANAAAAATNTSGADSTPRVRSPPVVGSLQREVPSQDSAESITSSSGHPATTPSYASVLTSPRVEQILSERTAAGAGSVNNSRESSEASYGSAASQIPPAVSSDVSILSRPHSTLANSYSLDTTAGSGGASDRHSDRLNRYDRSDRFSRSETDRTSDRTSSRDTTSGFERPSTGIGGSVSSSGSYGSSRDHRGGGHHYGETDNTSSYTPSRYTTTSTYDRPKLTSSYSSTTPAATTTTERDTSGSNTTTGSNTTSGSTTTTGRSIYQSSAPSTYRSRIARSKSSHLLGLTDDTDDDEEEESNPPPASTYRSRYSIDTTNMTSTPKLSTVSSNRGRYHYKTRDNSPPLERPSYGRNRQESESESTTTASGRTTTTGDRDNHDTSDRYGTSRDSTTSGPYSSYLRSKYSTSRAASGSGSGSAGGATGGGASGGNAGSGSGSDSRETPVVAPKKSRSFHELSTHHAPHHSTLRETSDESEEESDDDDEDKPPIPTRKLSAGSEAAAASQPGVSGPGGYTSFPRWAYIQKRKPIFKIGKRGNDQGCFTWPRGVVCGPDNSIVVADSSNHRVQVFDPNGRFMFEFGSYGQGEGEFDCLAGVAVNRIGQFIVSDRYNHRIQIFDPSGRFLRAFGSEGRADGRFSYPWGIATDSLGFIYVCDKDNHRVQVFQSDGTFVGKFGAIGSRPAQFDNPHYVTVSSTNRVIVSDSNNHRIQVFDVNGRITSTIGTEGTGEGQFKFPRGVAVDDQGYIIVGDSGNNRVQIFSPDGTFLRAFGCWGSSDAEFKGLEGVAVSSTGNILVCDRENHRIQVF